METESETTRRFAAQLPGNLIFNIAYFLVSVAIGILLVPYFISTLGIAAYGLIPLATSVTGYVAIVVASLNSSVSRFLTIDLQKNDYEAANRTFNTAFFGLSVVIALMIPIVLIVSYFVPAIFNVPAGQETGAIILFICTSGAFFIRALNGTFTVQLFAYNRLDLINSVNIINLLVQVGLTVLLFWLKGPSLIFVGAGFIAGAIIASAVSVILARRVCPHLFLCAGSFDRSRVKVLGEMSSWLFINEIGTLLFLQIDLIVVNMFFGATSAGEYAIVLTWGNLLRAIAGVLGGVLTPMVLTFFALEHTETMIRITKSAVKIMGLTMALPISLVCGFAPQLLTIWVGEKYVFLAPLMILLTIHLMINLTVPPLFSINGAYNRVKVPGMVTLILGIGNFALAVILSLFSGWGYYGVAAAGALVLTFKNAVFTPWYATKVLGVRSNTFTRAMAPGLAAGILLSGTAALLGFVLPLYHLLPLIITMGVLSIVYAILVWRTGLSQEERTLFGSYLPEKIRKFVV
jgi:membrane protein EpsK